MKPSQDCVDLVRKFEGLRTEAYVDQGGIWTIGYGHTGSIKSDMIINQHEAEEFLQQDLQKACDCVLNSTDVGLKQNELDALCCFVFNIGCHAFKNSTLCAKLNQGKYGDAAKEFMKWDHVHGQVVQGLLNRRLAEYALFTRVDDEPIAA